MNEPAPLSGSNSSKVKGTDVGYQVISSHLITFSVNIFRVIVFVCQITASVDLTSVWQDPHDPTHILLELLVIFSLNSTFAVNQPTRNIFFL